MYFNTDCEDCAKTCRNVRDGDEDWLSFSSPPPPSHLTIPLVRFFSCSMKNIARETLIVTKFRRGLLSPGELKNGRCFRGIRMCGTIYTSTKQNCSLSTETSYMDKKLICFMRILLYSASLSFAHVHEDHVK